MKTILKFFISYEIITLIIAIIAIIVFYNKFPNMFDFSIQMLKNIK